MEIVMDTLHNFGATSGLEINANKSKIFTLGVNNEEMLALQSMSGFSLGEFPVRHLGVPLMHRKLKTSHFALLLRKSQTKLKDGR